MLALHTDTRPLVLLALVQCGALTVFGSALQAATVAAAAAAAAQAMAPSVGSSAGNILLVELLVCAKYLQYKPTGDDHHKKKLSFSAMQQALAKGGQLHVTLQLLLDPTASPTPRVCNGECSVVP